MKQLNTRQKQSLFFGMMFVVGIILIFFALYLIFGGGIEYETYTNDQYRISILYPSNWIVSHQVQGSVVAFISPKEHELDVFQENVSIIVTDVASLSKRPLNFQSYTQTAIEQLIGTFAGHFEVTESSSMRVAGLPAHRFSYQETHPENPNPLHITHVWFLKDGFAYQINYGATINTYDRHLPHVNKMIRSFAFK